VTALRVVLVGAGGMGTAWAATIAASTDAELVGVVDLNLVAAQAAVAKAGVPGVVTGTDLLEVIAATGADAVVNATVPEAHHPVNVAALFAGLPVLCEKPIAPTVSQALSLAAAAEVSGQLLMVSQSRRYYATLARYRQQLASLGELGILTTDFFKAPHFGGFRDEMAHVLLVDMAIHAFDAARYLLDDDPAAVYCEEFNPGWSWYAGAANAVATFEFSSGARYVYTGSWCAPGLETSWNGSWRASGALGSATWDGAGEPVMERTEPTELPPIADGPEEIAGSLAEFIHAVRTGEEPSGEVHRNVLSLAMVEAAVLSAESGRRIVIDDVLRDARTTAIADEQRPDLRAALGEIMLR
jgi:predicted dehydrogenase